MLHSRPRQSKPRSACSLMIVIRSPHIFMGQIDPANALVIRREGHRDMCRSIILERMPIAGYAENALIRAWR